MQKHNSGFTLIEILVSINIGSVIIVITLFFYLFIFKFSANIGKKFNEEIEVTQFLSRLENRLEILDKYEVIISRNLILIPISQTDTVSVCDTLLSNVNGYFIKDISNVTYNIQLLSGESVGGKLSSIKVNSIESQIIKSEDINSINVFFEQQNKKYSLRYTTPYLSKRRFINITNND